MHIGQYIKKKRLECGLTQRQLSYQAQISNTEISRIEKGIRSHPSPHTLQKLSGPLGVTYEELLNAAGYLTAQEDSPPYTVNLPVLKQIYPPGMLFNPQNIDGYIDFPASLIKQGEHFFWRPPAGCCPCAWLPGNLLLVRRQEEVGPRDTALLLQAADQSFSPLVQTPRSGSPAEHGGATGYTVIGRVVMILLDERQLSEPG